MPELKPGEPAPSFKAADRKGKPFSSDDLRGTRTVLYFFPKADTSGWTTEARQFDELLPEFKKRKVRVVGMSPDQPSALEAFCQKYDLDFTFLSDPDHSTLEAYGAWGERPGRDPGVIRSTVLLSPDGNVEKVWYRVSPDGHAAQVLGSLDAEAVAR